MTAPSPLSALAEMPPWLTAPTASTDFVSALTTVVPELADGRIGVTSCKPKLRLKSDRPGWSVSYDVGLVGPDHAPREVRLTGTFMPPGLSGRSVNGEAPATATGIFATPGWTGSFPALGLEVETETADDALPALGDLIDPVAARALLEDAIRGVGRPDFTLGSARPDIRRYKPGSRCTIFYELGYGAGSDGPVAVVAKTYRGTKGLNAFEGMSALWDTGISQRGIVGLAEPLAYLSDSRVLVQACVPENQTLKELVREAVGGGDADVATRLRAAIAQTATGLAALHTSGVVHGETVTWDDECQEIAELCDRLRPLLPQVAQAADDLRSALEVQANIEPADPAVTAHRSFRPAQVLLGDQDVSFIDFDGLCMAEPALDVALFRASLRDAGTRGYVETGHSGYGDLDSTLDFLDDLADHFLERYQAQATVSGERVRLWEALDQITSALHCWTKIKPDRLAVRVRVLERRLTATDAQASG